MPPRAPLHFWSAAVFLEDAREQNAISYHPDDRGRMRISGRLVARERSAAGGTGGAEDQRNLANGRFLRLEGARIGADSGLRIWGFRQTAWPTPGMRATACHN